MHNSNNLYNIRGKINGREVVFTSNTAMSGSKGVCVICHSQTAYHNATANAPVQHYDNRNCMDCHPHRKGFPSFTTVLMDFFGRLFAWAGINTAYAEPAPLENYSMGGFPESPIGTFELTVTLVSKPKAPPTPIVKEVFYYYHNDHLGTPLFMTDDNGKVVWQREQMPFGETTYERGSVTENLRFPGQYWDEEKETSDNGFRTYNQILGRYSEADPIGQEGGVNKYIYVHATPLMLIDIRGLDTICKEARCNSKEIEQCRTLCASQGKRSRTCSRIFILQRCKDGSFCSYTCSMAYDTSKCYGPITSKRRAI